MHFARSGVFTLTFAPNASIGADTEIFLPVFRYPLGYRVELQPAAAPFAWRPCPQRANVLCMTTTDSTVPPVVTVTVHPISTS